MSEEDKTVEENKTGTEQTAATDTDGRQNDVSSEDNADAAQDGDLLADLLKEFDEKRDEGVRESESKDSTADIDVSALAQLEQRLNEAQNREEQRELEVVVSKLSSGLEVSKTLARGFLNAMAEENPKLNEVYRSRFSNPTAWDKTQKALRKEFEKTFGKKVDKQVTESRHAVESAVRSASTAAPDREHSDQDLANMSKEDFDKLQRKLGVIPA